ncbi:glycosyltransferase family 4 protein [Gilvimarinus xylanilyticus]|uniref:Glycosyltransferase family 4 protein n=1 Tax=Gilvimarinus xylanilyticus TaxID=2944139 RepID=A0A9X2I012_9GAMM|nr:glycosyltransferase family 4 protein [Gilvimarinus xylanilyticus]MCP8900219.1 glycosyltransferase family 4 protein [Gilvimarinus xylanilyticus]
MNIKPAIWFPTVETNTGTDVFTERLVKGLNELGLQAEITWLPLRAEYAPWSVPVPKPPKWATITHVNTWMHPRFIPINIPVVATIHHAVHHPNAQSYKGFARSIYHSKWIAPIERRIMRSATKLIAVSHFSAQSARASLVDLPIEVIYNGVDTSVFTPPMFSHRPNERFRLLYIGSWAHRKGVDLLEPIMKLLDDSFELWYTGGKASSKDKQSMPSNMIDIGRLNSGAEVAKIMQLSDALCFPSRSEGHPQVVLEAMASGLPILATKGSAVEEILNHGKTGLLSGPEDTYGMAQHANTLKKDHTLRSSIAKSARSYAINTFSIQRMYEKYIKFYVKILSDI